jgi:anti-sigma regulatory factor (Ser/Thr protein kinase)
MPTAAGPLPEQVFPKVVSGKNFCRPATGRVCLMTDLVDIAIRRDPTAPASARQAVEEFARTIEPTLVPDVKLLVSELITNSVKYGGDGEVHLQMRSDHEGHIRVEVVDQGSGFIPVPRDRPATEVGGWGLHLVETLTDRWGVHEGSTHVWFEIDRAA